LSSWSERLVGVALIGVGIWGARRAAQLQVHRHEHVHGAGHHEHIHVHADHGHGAAGQTHQRKPHDHTHASFAFGILHGLAGSAHVLGILPALALPTRLAAAGYMICYGIGTIAAMTAFAGIVGAVSSRAADGGTRAFRGLLYTCSAAAMLVGAVWLVT
jgi:sulfite exporter TauE/SafE